MRTRNNCKWFLIAYFRGWVGVFLWWFWGIYIKQLKNSEEFLRTAKIE